MAIGIVGLAVWIVASAARSGSGAGTGPAVAAKVTDGVQEISMDLSPAGYSPNNITVKKGIPVKINTNATADAGCVRGIMIPDFNINVALDVGSDSFTFTPDKTGTFEFTCQMKMSRGTITVI